MDIFKEELKDALCNNDLEFLLYHRYQYDIDERFGDENNDSLLLYSLSDKESQSYLFLLEQGADVSLVNDDGEGCYHAAVYADDVGRMKKLYQYAPSNQLMNLRSHDGTTPLLLSIFLEHYESFLWLMESGASTILSNQDGVYPAHAVCMIEDRRFFRYLYEAGIDFNVATKTGVFPVGIAREDGLTDIVSVLEFK